MDARLKVVGGSKSGSEIPLKKAKFVIGRSPECSLRAGSDAISRRHCEIRLTRSEISIVDLGSRNGTFVNGNRIEREEILESGDEVGIGPLKFQVIVQHGLNTQKRPVVKTIAEVAARSAQEVRTDDKDYEDDITKWLTDPPGSDSRLMNETMSMRVDETNAVADISNRSAESNPSAESTASEAAEKTSDSAVEQEEMAETRIHCGRKKKPKPGKLPRVAKGPSAKDSREAAVEVLRAMTRRR